MDAPRLGLALLDDVLVNGLDESLGSALGIPAGLARTAAPSPVLGVNVNLLKSLNVALPAGLARADAPGVSFGIWEGLAAVKSGSVVGEVLLQAQAAVPEIRIRLSGSDDASELIEVALGQEGGATLGVGKEGLGGALEEAVDVAESSGEGLGGTLHLPAGLARVNAPRVGLGCRLRLGGRKSLAFHLLPARLVRMVTPRFGLGDGHPVNSDCQDGERCNESHADDDGSEEAVSAETSEANDQRRGDRLVEIKWFACLLFRYALERVMSEEKVDTNMELNVVFIDAQVFVALALKLLLSESNAPPEKLSWPVRRGSLY